MPGHPSAAFFVEALSTCLGTGHTGWPSPEPGWFVSLRPHNLLRRLNPSLIDRMQDGVESESEAVTLGEDPYSDYSLSADDHIIMGYHPVGFSRAPQGGGPPQQMQEQYAGFHGPPLEDMVGSSSDLSDILPASVFEGGGATDGPSDPYYF